jgi:hypothetical protein
MGRNHPKAKLDIIPQKKLLNLVEPLYLHIIDSSVKKQKINLNYFEAF